MPNFDPQLLKAVQKEAKTATAERDQITHAVAKNTAEITSLRARLSQLESQGNLEGAAATRARLTEVEAQRQSAVGRLSAADERFRAALERLRSNVCGIRSIRATLIRACH
jgi:hypothetical protein